MVKGFHTLPRSRHEEDQTVTAALLAMANGLDPGPHFEDIAPA
jgi:hypothetical protein